MGFISYHITPLVIYSLGVDTHMHTNRHTNDPHRTTFKKPGAYQQKSMSKVQPGLPLNSYDLVH